MVSESSVGPAVSGEQFWSGFYALGIAMLLMLAYIWFRFQLQFGLGAVIAIFHDVLLTLGLLSVAHVEFNMSSIAALLRKASMVERPAYQLPGPLISSGFPQGWVSRGHSACQRCNRPKYLRFVALTATVLSLGVVTSSVAAQCGSG